MIEAIKDIAASYPTWAKVVLAVSGGIFVLTLVFARTVATPESAPDKKSPLAPTMRQEVIGTGRDAYNFQGSPVTIVQQSQEKDTRPLKERIRAYLRTVNPKIIELLDSGQRSVAVMINVVNQQALFELQKDPDFGAYLEVRSTGSVAAGAHNTIGGHLNDLQDVGMLNGFEFVFKDRLRLE